MNPAAGLPYISKTQPETAFWLKRSVNMLKNQGNK